MAGIDASIPLQTKRPDTFGKLSDLMGMQSQATQIKLQKTALAGEQQSLKQRQGLANFDYASLSGDDGTIDLNKVMSSGLREAAGDEFPDQLSKLVGIKQQQVQAKSQVMQLTGQMRGAFAEAIGGLGSDPDVANDTPAGREKVAQAGQQLLQTYGPDIAPVLKAYAPVLTNAPQGKLSQVLKNIQLQATSAGDQLTRQTPNFQYQNTGPTAERRQTNPFAPGGEQMPQSVQLGIGPGEQSTMMTDQMGNPLVARRDARGNIINAAPLAGTQQFGVGERQSFEHQAEANFQAVSANRTAASLAPQQLDQINKAYELSKTVNTGRWAAERAGIESGISSLIPGLSSASNDATKLQLLDKFAERIAADSARVLGANSSTDAARESITRQNANIGYTPKAIQEVLQYAKAQTLAMAAKGDAQESWLKKEGNGITKQHDFETKWRQAYDPVLFQIDAAPNAEERKAIIGKLSKEHAAQLVAKRKELRELGAIK